MAARKEDIGKGAGRGKDTAVPVRGGGGLVGLRDEVNRLFDRFTGIHWPVWGSRRAGEPWPQSLWYGDPFRGFEWPSAWGGEGTLGRADLSETDSGFELQIDLPGLHKDDISVDYSGGILTVAGERSDEREDKRKGYYLSERSYGSVRRSFRIPDSVKTDEIRADFKDGVLTLTLPKSEEAKTSSRRIEVE